ncbi:MAG: hypothetical protein CMD98_06585 [Gammaproteobacteria bacterium]|nr:hypothetical protein [Gammaproteobacteria bacterium]
MSLDKTLNPNAEFSIQTMMLPDVTAEGTLYPTRSRNLTMSADKLVYAPFEVTFLVDEDLGNYKEIYDWIYTQVDSKQDDFRDITLSVLSSANKVNKQIIFHSAHPTSLSSLPFDITTQDIEYVVASVSFEYSYFEIV